MSADESTDHLEEEFAEQTCALHNLVYKGACPECSEIESKASLIDGLSSGLKKGLGKLTPEERKKMAAGIDGVKGFLEKLKSAVSK